MNARELGPLGVAAVLLLTGAVRVSQGGGEGWPLFGLGAMCLGAWLAILIYHWREDRKVPPQTTPRGKVDRA